MAHKGVHGLQGRSGADALDFDTCAYLAGRAQSGQVVGGISYDFEKCFDRGPVALAINLSVSADATTNFVRHWASCVDSIPTILLRCGGIAVQGEGFKGLGLRVWG